MKTTILIDQRFAFSVGGDLDLIDWALFDFLKAYALQLPVTTTSPYAFVKPKTILEQMPLLRLKSEKAIKDRVAKLENANLITLREAKGYILYALAQGGKNYDWCERGESVAPKEKSKETSDIKERENKFRAECRAYEREFGFHMVEEFYLYWSEPNKSKTKMRFEQQPTWELHRRLQTWARRNNKSTSQGTRAMSVNEALNKAYGK